MTHERTTAIVTGASSGIGLALARAFLERGHNVVANSRRILSSSKLEPSECLALVEGDVAAAEVGQELVATASRRFGGVDLVVNNAGVFVPKPFTDYTDEDVARLVSTNLMGFFNVTQPAVRVMRAQRHGHIVSISTSLVDQPIAGVPAAIPILTKGGLNAVTRALAVELAEDGIRVNAVGAGVVDTPMHPPESHDFLKRLHPIPRLASVDEIVAAVFYLNDAGFVSGEVLHVDGGAHAGKW